MIARTGKICSTAFADTCRRFMKDRAGNIAMTFAIVSVPLLGAMGAAIDYSRALNLQQEIQGNLDAALVATVKQIGAKDEAALKQQLANWLAAESQNSGEYQLDMASVVIDTTNSTITATVKADVETTFMRILGRNSVPVSVQASVTGGDIPGSEEKNAFSMYFVLDRSGSMGEPTKTKYTTTCYKNEKKQTGAYACTKLYTKMESLQLAVGSLTNQLATADPDLKYVRTAAVSYDDQMDTPAALAWGEDHVRTYVDNLSPRNLTDSSKAMATAYAALVDTSAGKDENKIHQARNGVTAPKKYIVFMTDGENTKMQGGRVVDNPTADTNTKATCDAARKDGVIVYSIAFMAPERGQALLKYCATTSDDYYEAENTAALVAAFESIAEAASEKVIRLTN